MIGVRRAHDAAVVVNLCDMRTQLGRILMGAKDVREKHLFSKNDVFSSECASRLHRSHYIIASVAFVFGFSYPSATPRQCCHGVATGCASDGNEMITSRSPSTQSWRKIKNVTFFFEPKKTS